MAETTTRLTAPSASTSPFGMLEISVFFASQSLNFANGFADAAAGTVLVVTLLVCATGSTCAVCMTCPPGPFAIKIKLCGALAVNCFCPEGGKEIPCTSTLCALLEFQASVNGWPTCG